MAEKKEKRKKVEWEGKEISIPEPFSKVDHLLNYIVSLLGWQLQNGVQYSSLNDLTEDIQTDIDIPEEDLDYIYQVLDLHVPINPSEIDYGLSSNTLNFDVDLDTIKSRRSVRVFNGKNVTDDEIMQVLEAARYAPSARNIQPIEYIVVRDENTKEKLSNAARQKQPLNSPVSIVVVGDLSRAGMAGRLSIHDTTTNNKGVQFFIYMDAAASIQNMLLAANKLGIGSLWISSFDEKALGGIMKLPEDHIPLAIITLGRYDGEKTVPPRRSPEELVHVEKYEEKNHDPRHYNFSRLIHLRY